MVYRGAPHLWISAGLGRSRPSTVIKAARRRTYTVFRAGPMGILDTSREAANRTARHFTYAKGPTLLGRPAARIFVRLAHRLGDL